MSDLTRDVIEKWCEEASPTDLADWGAIISRKRESLFDEGKSEVQEAILSFAIEHKLEAAPEIIKLVIPSFYDVARELAKRRPEILK